MYILNLYHKVVKINGCLDGYLDDAVCVLQERKRVKFANRECGKPENGKLCFKMSYFRSGLHSSDLNDYADSLERKINTQISLTNRQKFKTEVLL